MNFSQVNTLLIPEGAVRKLTDSQGNVLWQMETLYRELEYIESNSNAINSFIINLNISHDTSGDNHLDLKYAVNNASQFYGAMLAGSNNTILAYIEGSGTGKPVRARWNTNSWPSNNLQNSFDNNAHTIGIYRANVYFDGTQVTTTSRGNVTNLSLFSQTPDATQYSIIGKFYYLKTTTSDTSNYLHDIVPVQRKSDSVIGVYDKVTGIFYPNNGTGTFIAGPTVDENPSWSDEFYIDNNNSIIKYFKGGLNTDWDTTNSAKSLEKYIINDVPNNADNLIVTFSGSIGAGTPTTTTNQYIVNGTVVEQKVHEQLDLSENNLLVSLSGVSGTKEMIKLYSVAAPAGSSSDSARISIIYDKTNHRIKLETYYTNYNISPNAGRITLNNILIGVTCPTL